MGTYDVSLLEISDGVFEVLATAGDNHLGGDDFDAKVVKYLSEEIKKEHGIDVSSDKMVLQRLKDAAEKAKIELSGSTTTEINLPYLTATSDGPIHFSTTLTRAKFNELTVDLIDRVKKPINQVLSDAGVATSDIDKVILVGGSTRIPAVQELVKNVTGKEPFKGINPDECVAIGAAIQAAVLDGEVHDVLLLDVTPLSLGIETMGGVFTKIIDRNTTIPVKKSQIFSTAADNQPAVTIHVLQGERSMASDNTTLGRFDLDGIPPARRGVPQIEVTFDIDANGIVNVSAKDKGTDKEQHITITSSSNMSQDDIEKAVKDAEKYAEADKQKREEVDTKNNADNLIFQTTKSLEDLGDKVTEEEKKSITEAQDKLKETLKDGSVEDIRADMDALQKAFGKISERIYQENASAENTTENNQDGTTYTTDYEDKSAN